MQRLNNTSMITEINLITYKRRIWTEKLLKTLHETIVTSQHLMELEYPLVLFFTLIDFHVAENKTYDEPIFPATGN